MSVEYNDHLMPRNVLFLDGPWEGRIEKVWGTSWAVPIPPPRLTVEGYWTDDIAESFYPVDSAQAVYLIRSGFVFSRKLWVGISNPLADEPWSFIEWKLFDMLIKPELKSAFV